MEVYHIWFPNNHNIIVRIIISGYCHDLHRGPGSSGMYQVGTKLLIKHREISTFIKRDTQKNDDEDLNYWREKGSLELEKALNLQLNENVAKVIMKYFWCVMLSSGRQNIIIFIGDGMSLPTVTAARTYKSQQKVWRWSFHILSWNYVIMY